MDTERDAASKVATQHRLIESLLKGLRAALAAADPDRARRRLASLRRALDAHFVLEEEHYFPRLRASRPAVEEDVRALRTEHDEMRARLDHLGAQLEAPPAGDAAASAAELAAFFTRHEARERELLGA